MGRYRIFGSVFNTIQTSVQMLRRDFVVYIVLISDWLFRGAWFHFCILIGGFKREVELLMKTVQ